MLWCGVKSLLATEKSDHFYWNFPLLWCFRCLFYLLLPRTRSLQYAPFLSYRIVLNIFLCWYNPGTRCACCIDTRDDDLGQSHWRGERQNPTLWAGYPHERPSKLFSDAVLGDILIIFSWEIHHSWTFRHSPFTDTQIQVNKELFTTDCPRVHLPFPFRLLPPSAFYIPEVTHRSKHNSCCSWPQHPQPVSHLCSSQRCHVARGCLCSCESHWFIFV